MKHELVLKQFLDNSYRILIFKILVVIIILFGSILSAANVSMNGWVVSAQLELMVAAISFCVLLNFKILNKNAYFRRIASTYIIFICLMLNIIFCRDSLHSIQLWILAVPLMSYLLLGEKLGFWITFITILFSSINFYINLSSEIAVLDDALILNSCLLFITVWFISHVYERSTSKAQHSIAMIAAIDPLTKLLNRNTLDVAFVINAKQGLSLLLFDIDFFKKVNDKYGHEVGDLVIVSFSELLENYFGNKGFVFRVGGEEFAVILPKYDKKQAYDLAEEFLEIIEKYDIHTDDNQTLNITFSAGLSTVTSNHSEKPTLKKIMDVADTCLYQAKKNGRNQIVCEVIKNSNNKDNC